MIAKLTVSLILLTAVAAVAPAASAADPLALSDCGEAGPCVGAELQPVADTRCAGVVCDAINVACGLVFRHPCVR